MVAPSSDSTSLKEYLKKYESGYEEEKKKKKKKKKAKTDVSGVIIVDEDPVWQKPVTIDEEEDDSAGNLTNKKSLVLQCVCISWMLALIVSIKIWP